MCSCTGPESPSQPITRNGIDLSRVERDSQNGANKRTRRTVFVSAHAFCAFRHGPKISGFLTQSLTEGGTNAASSYFEPE